MHKPMSSFDPYPTPGEGTPHLIAHRIGSTSVQECSIRLINVVTVDSLLRVQRTCLPFVRNADVSTTASDKVRRNAARSRTSDSDNRMRFRSLWALPS